MFDNIILPKDFYKKVEEDGYLKHIHYGDSVAENTKTIIKKSSNNHIEEITFLDLWNYLESINLKKEFINEKEYIFINDEEIKSICFNSKNDSFEIKPIKYIMRHKIHKTIKKLNITNFENILITEDHSILKYDKIKKELIKCNINDINYITVPKNEFNISIDEFKIDPLYFLLGVWLGNGTFDSKTYYPCFSMNKKEKFIEYIKSFNISSIKIYDKTKFDFWVNWKDFTNLLNKFNYNKVKSPSRTLDDGIFVNLNFNIFMSLLVGYWVSDGSYSLGTYSISSSCLIILEQIKTILILNGIYTHIIKDKNGRKFNNIIKGDMYVLKFIGINKFIRELFFSFKDMKSNPCANLNIGHFYGNSTTKNNICRNDKNAHLFNVKPVKITKIEDVFYDGYVYDLEINEIHNFIANGYIVHNTDSIFPTFPIENPDKLSIDELWNKVSEHAKNINNLIELYCNHTLFERCNIDPQHNHTSFKTEMVLDSLLLLDIKKVYAYKVLIEKGKIKNKIEYKGFPIIRSDYSQLTKDILREFIEKIIFNKDIKLEDKYDHIINVYNKYYSLFVDNINKSDFSYVGIPAKWAKKIQYINGMSLYNFLVNKNVFSYGSSGKFVYCIFKNKNLFKKITGIEDISKLNGICIPYKYDLEFLKNKFNEFDIEIDTKVHWDTIFNKTCFRTKNLIKRLSGKNLI